jgi:hypothetical protein
MAFFREDDFDDPHTSYVIAKSSAEKLETVRWYIWCGWGKDARKLLHEIARDVPDYEDVSYEDKRFAQES